MRIHFEAFGTIAVKPASYTLQRKTTMIVGTGDEGLMRAFFL